MGESELEPNDIKEWVRKRKEKDVRLYEDYGKRLEPEHSGEFVAISDDGEVIIGVESLTVDREALVRFGTGRYAFRRIGYPAEAKWRRSR